MEIDQLMNERFPEIKMSVAFYLFQVYLMSNISLNLSLSSMKMLAAENTEWIFNYL